MAEQAVAFELKAAGLAVGILLATPYVYLYDLAILAVSGAFLVRLAIKTGFRPGETIALALITSLVLVLPFLGVPVGLPAAAIAALLIARRVCTPYPVRTEEAEVAEALARSLSCGNARS